MSIESKIQVKAAGLYIIAGIAVAVMLVFLYQMRSHIGIQKHEIEKQHNTLALTNKLIYAVGDAQSSVSQYVATNNTFYIRKFRRNLVVVDALIDSLATIEPLDKQKLKQVSSLLTRQASNISKLNLLLIQQNPSVAISEKIRQFKPKEHENLSIVTVKQDTILNTGKRKNFFSRIKEVFTPAKNKTVVVTTRHSDTISLGNTESFNMLTEVDSIAQNADKHYRKNMQAIGQRISGLISADRKISTQISELLLQLHRQTYNSVLSSIEHSEKSINRNYMISIIGAGCALLLILLFIILIIYDVNKGKQARDKIRQVMESRHQLLLSVSHDIKSPLSSILGHLELRQQQGNDIQSMQNSARHILALLENLLEFSSLEQGSLKLSESDFSLHALADEICHMFLPLAEAKNLSFSCQSDKVRIHSDQMKIKQIIINLISNSIKYTSQGMISFQINYANEKLSLVISDTGAGIPNDKLAEIFEPFTRVENNNKLAHGSGLGLFVVKGLIELLSGTIDLKSEPGKGTTVEVHIPCSKATFAIRKGTLRIAVYEDDPSMEAMVNDMLLQLGHNVVEKEPDTILTDMEMGDISGLDVLATAENIPVVVMTGHSDFTAEKAKALGFDGFLAKPFTLDALRDIFGEGEAITNDLWGVDMEEILTIFRATTAENLALLNEALTENNFKKAQSICHKMLPMFVQLGYPSMELGRMDASRGEPYEGWQTDVVAVLSIKV